MIGTPKSLDSFVEDPKALEDALSEIFGLFEQEPTPQIASRFQAGESSYLGPYQLLEKLGEGGVARVMKGRHIHPRYCEHALAVKILQEELSKDPHVIDLFRNEAYVLSQLKHPNLVSTFEAGEQDGNLFIAMEQIHGHDLDNLLFRCQKLDQRIPIPVAMFIVGEVLKGLTFAHELTDGYGAPLNLIHRDVNPANVFISYQGSVKLGDFGIAKIAAGRLERVREVAGKAGYFAPEQLEGWSVDQRTDLFSIGVMMFELLCGVWLFDDRDTGRMITQNRKAKIPKPRKYNPNIPKEIEKVILKTLRRKSKDRFQTARGLYDAIQEYIPGPEACRLSLTSLMRDIFSLEYAQRLEGHLSNAPVEEGVAPHREHITLVARAESDVQPFSKLLKSQQYQVDVVTKEEALRETLRLKKSGLLMLASNHDDNFLHGLKNVVNEFPAVPVIMVTDQYDPAFAVLAATLNAVDILQRPYRLTRVTMAIRHALSALNYFDESESPCLTFATESRPRIALITKDSDLAQSISPVLEDNGFFVERLRRPEDALERASSCSYHALVWDNCENANWEFVEKYRSEPGMGSVPFLCLTQNRVTSHWNMATMNQVLFRMRDDSSQVIANALLDLHSQGIVGRAFTRYPIEVDVAIRYGGRVFKAQAGDLSRGGVLLYCTQIPPVGIEVGIALHFKQFEYPIEVLGKVVRVDLSRRHGDSRTGIGVEFTRFAPQCEEQLIEVLAHLEPLANQRRSEILGFSKL